jgi:hypothetical protein
LPVSATDYEMRYYQVEFNFTRRGALLVLRNYLRDVQQEGDTKVSIPNRMSKRYRAFYRRLEHKTFDLIGFPYIYGGSKHFNAAKMQLVMPYIELAKNTRGLYNLKRALRADGSTLEFTIDLQSKAHVYTRLVVGRDPKELDVSHIIIRKVKDVEPLIDREQENGLDRIPEEYMVGENVNRSERYVFVRLLYERNFNWAPTSVWVDLTQLSVIHPKKRQKKEIMLNYEKS